ncbi:MAG TPA: hypothetical protein VMR97_11175 [Acidimicrobiales bacterium]|nr:hypothetical protein [Acidimicrobiales bacterium]
MEPGRGVADTRSPNGSLVRGGSGRQGADGGELPGPTEIRRSADPPRRPPGPSTHLALIVLAIAAGLMVVGTVAAGLTGGTPAPVRTSTPTARGSPLRAVASGPQLSAIVAGGLPPKDIVAALALPNGTTAVPGSAVNEGVGSYDRQIGLSVPASEQDVIDFFRLELPAERWSVESRGPVSAGGYRLLGQHPGSNGYEWEVGVTVMPETFTGGAAGSGTTASAGPTSAGTTPVTLRIFEITNDQ